MSESKPERIPMSETLVCQCGWYGTVDEQDALGTKNGCCPKCGNEDLDFLNEWLQIVEVWRSKPDKLVIWDGSEWLLLGRFKNWCWLGRLDEIKTTWQWQIVYQGDVEVAESKPTEKERRIYYQDLVYYACRQIDKVSSGHTSCGTVDLPTDNFKARLDAVLLESVQEIESKPKPTEFTEKFRWFLPPKEVLLKHPNTLEALAHEACDRLESQARELAEIKANPGKAYKACDSLIEQLKRIEKGLD